MYLFIYLFVLVIYFLVILVFIIRFSLVCFIIDHLCNIEGLWTELNQLWTKFNWMMTIIFCRAVLQLKLKSFNYWILQHLTLLFFCFTVKLLWNGQYCIKCCINKCNIYLFVYLFLFVYSIYYYYYYYLLFLVLSIINISYLSILKNCLQGCFLHYQISKLFHRHCTCQGILLG